MKKGFFYQNTILFLSLLLISSALLWPQISQAKRYENPAILKLQAVDYQGLKVVNARFNVYKQESDINGHFIFGKNLASGRIEESGEAEFEIGFDNNETNKIAIEYYVANKPFQKFTVWNRCLCNGCRDTIILPFSSLGVILKDSDGHLLKDIKYDIYSVTTDVAGRKVIDYLIFSSQITGVTGESRYYLVPGDYIVVVRYPETRKYNTEEHYFTVYDGQLTKGVAVLSRIKVGAKDSAGNWSKNAEFKIFRKLPILNTPDYIELEKFRTGDTYKLLYLPSGDYIIEFKDDSKNFVKAFEFYLSTNQDRIFIYGPKYQTQLQQDSAKKPCDFACESGYYLNSDSLYDVDSDGDHLADFEEAYIWKTNLSKADSDNDSYLDNTEIKYGYNPKGSGRYAYYHYSYGKPRLGSLSMESNLASSLRTELEKRLGGSLNISADHWQTLVKAYIYGGYSIEEIKATIVNGAGSVHPSIPAKTWRNR